VRESARIAKEAEAVAQSRAFDIDGTVVSPPPTGYRLTAAQQTTAKARLDAFGVMVENGVAWMHQEAQPVIPYLLDASSAGEVVAGTRIYDPCYPRRIEAKVDGRWRETSIIIDGIAHYPTTPT